MTLACRASGKGIARLRRPSSTLCCASAQRLRQWHREDASTRLRPGAAHFHASAPRRVDDAAATAAVDTTEPGLNAWESVVHSGIDALHASTGLPWAYTIPLSAFLLRALCLPVVVGNRKAGQRYLDVQPLLSAWMVKIKHSTNYHLSHKGAAFRTRTAREDYFAKRGQLLRRWRCGAWARSNWIFVQLPLFVSMTDIYRRMCGMPQGVFARMAGNLFGLLTGSRAEAGPVPSVLDPTLAHEGMLWFPDLMLPDHTWSLTGSVVAMNLALATWSTWKAYRRLEPGQALSTRQRALTTFSVGFSLALVPLTAGLPAGVMLYWASSTAATIVSNLAMDAVYPLRPSPKACRRRAKISFAVDKR